MIIFLQETTRVDKMLLIIFPPKISLDLYPKKLLPNYTGDHHQLFSNTKNVPLLGGLFFWGKVTSKIFKLEERDYKKEERSITALSVYWLFLFIVWFVFFTIMFVYNDAVLDWCRSLIS